MEKVKQPIGRPPLISKDEQERWRGTYGIEHLNHRAIYFLNQMKQDDILKAEHELAGYLLYNSCESRINACQYATGIYAQVACNWSEPSSFWFDINNLKPEMWNEWIRLTEEYFSSGFSNHLRPTIDRQDESIGYTLSNIQALSFADNTKKATRKPQYIFDLNNKTFKKYDNRKDALAFLGQTKEQSDTGGIFFVDEKPYLLQSKELSEKKKPFDEKEWDDSEATYGVMLPIAQFELPNGRIATISQEFHFQRMAVFVTTVENNT